MNIRWCFGPDRVPFELDAAGALGGAGALPLHGIVPRGMLEPMAADPAAAAAWARWAHLVLGDPAAAVAEDVAWGSLRAHAALCQALSLAESASSARAYLRLHCPEAAEAAAVEAWNVKEGHTSSVGRISLLDGRGGGTELALNVARDRVAGVELASTSEAMRRIGAAHRDLRMARVHDIQTVPLARGAARLDVVVTRNDWIADAYEIHAELDATQRPRRYLLVERFLTAAAEPSRIVSIRGRPFGESEQRRIEDDLRRFHAQSESALGAPVELCVNHGDVVWDGRGATVVAIS